MDTIGELYDEEILGLCIQSTDRNILKFVAKKEFDYDAAYKNLYRADRDKELFEKSHALIMYKTLEIIQNQSFTKKIYIYSPEYDQRIYDDIKENMPNLKNVEYLCGGFVTAVKECRDLTTFIVPDIEFVKLLIDENLIKYTTVLLANYGYNYKAGKNNVAVLDIDGDIDDIMEKEHFKMSIFSPSALFNIIDNHTLQNMISITKYLEEKENDVTRDNNEQ